MAKGDKSNQTCKITLRHEVATDTYSNQTLNHINPSVTDDKFLIFGGKLAALTSTSVEKVIRTNSYDIAAE